MSRLSAEHLTAMDQIRSDCVKIVKIVLKNSLHESNSQAVSGTVGIFCGL